MTFHPARCRAKDIGAKGAKKSTCQPFTPPG